MGDKGFRVAQVVGDVDQLQFVQHLKSPLLGRAVRHVEFEGDDGAAAGHLSLGQVVLRVRCKERVTHPPHRRMRLQVLGDPLRRRVLVLDPNRQRLKAFEQHPGVEGAHRGSGVPHQFLHRAVDVFLVAEDRPTQHPALPVDVFGARVDHHVDPERKTLLQQRGRKNVVQHHFRPGSVSELGDRDDVDQ